MKNKYSISDKILCTGDPYSLFEANKVYEIEDIHDNKWFKVRGIDASFSINMLDKYFIVLDKEDNNMWAPFCETYGLHTEKENRERVKEIYNIGDLIKYKTPENPNGNYGHIVAIFEVKDDRDKSNINKILYKVSDLYQSNRIPVDVFEDNLLEVYSKIK